MTLQIMEGSIAVAETVRLCRPQVISAYPITPQTHIVEGLASIVADGRHQAVRPQRWMRVLLQCWFAG